MFRKLMKKKIKSDCCKLCEVWFIVYKFCLKNGVEGISMDYENESKDFVWFFCGEKVTWGANIVRPKI